MTIPNKLFDYMSVSLPVIASDAKPMKRILEEKKCGLTFRSGDSSDLAKVCINMYNSNVQFGENGRDAIQSEYNWKYDEQRLINILNQFS